MFVAFRHYLGLVVVLYLSSCVVGAKHEPGKTLYVAEDVKPSPGRTMVINRLPAEDDGLERTKRDIPTSLPTQKNITTWTTHLNDSHQQLMVHWVGEGSNVIICLAKDSTPRGKGSSMSPSALYISYNYGQNFTNKTESFRLGDSPDSGYAQLDKFFNHPKYPMFCVFVDSTNKKLFYTSDNGKNIYRSDLNFQPSELAFDEDFADRFVVLDKVDPNRKLYFTQDGGKTFTRILDFVKSFFWSSGAGFPKMFYFERWEPDGTSTISSIKELSQIMVSNVLFEKAKDFQIKGDYMFATRQSKEKNTLEFHISHQRGPFYKAEFQTELDLKKFHIADVTDKRIFVSVMHTDNLANLYVSEIGKNFTQYNFVLSLEQILCYFPDGNWKDSWLEDVTEDPFTDLYRVEGLKGIYIASKVDTRGALNNNNIAPEHVVSVMTFDHGVTWAPINPATMDENGKPLNCHIENSCSLHLCQKFSQLYPVTRSASIMSSKSAPGIIMATGVMGKSLKGIPGVYLSRDAGLTWKRILKDYYFFNYGDHGGVLVVVKYFKLRGETRRILYSTNEGIEWKSYKFNEEDLRIYGLMTEPGENTTTFTMFGSANDQHQWIIITLDLQNAFPKNCSADDYKYWSPSPPNSSVSCVLGVRDVYQRRLAHTNCYNGIDYTRPAKKEICECSRRDYECDYGFKLHGRECIRNKSVRHDPYAIPRDCKPGHYYKRTKGYRKIDDDACVSSAYIPYESDTVPCPIEEPTEFLLVALKDRIARIDLLTNTTIIPVTGQKNIVAIEFDMKNNCIYWADIEMDRIVRQCYNNGTTEEVVVGTELASIEGMALDYISNVLFFVDGMRRKIEAVRTDLTSEGRMRVTILDDKHLSKPRGITVHPKAGYLFWTDWDKDNPSVSRSNLDGTNVKKLFGTPHVYWPNGITIDQMADRIYWVDAKEDYIASSDLDGKFFRRTLWHDDKVSHPFAVAVLKDKIFWDDWKAKSIFLADKVTGENIVTISDSFTGLMDLKVFAHYVQHGTNACSFKNTSCDALCLGGPGKSFSCLCPDGFHKLGNKCVCPNGIEPFANMTCPKKSDGSCDEDQFKCKNGVCISSAWRCDGNNDCGDFSDEVGCRCEPPKIPCNNSQCYQPDWRCDGDLDCSDQSDEKDCGVRQCNSNQFQCGDGACIEKKWACDGDADCKDGSDERNCTNQPKRVWDTSSCSVNSYTCNGSSSASNAMCIPNSWVCDGDKDCPQGDDELKEKCMESTCAPYMFRCPNGKCIFKSWVCDGENDCSDDDSSDEKNCTAIGQSKIIPHPVHIPFEFPTNTSCLEWMFKCTNGKCLPYWWRCDGINDCGDNSDEVACGMLLIPDVTSIRPDLEVAPKKCAKNQFSCAPDLCIPLSWVCDNAEDCIDGSDEKGCTHPTSNTNKYGGHGHVADCLENKDETLCEDGKGCFKDTELCDGIPQCQDRSDEKHCGYDVKTPPISCPDGYFICDDSTLCLAQSKLCDKRQDCYDGSDEANCNSTENTHKYQFLGIGVDQSSINSTSFLISCWMAQQKMVTYRFLPAIAKVSDGIWKNMTWTNDSTYRFTNLEPFTNYNVTFFIHDGKYNETYASTKYVNATTGQGVPSPPQRLSVRQGIGSRLFVTFDAPSSPKGNLLYYTIYYAPPFPPASKQIQAGDITVSYVINASFKPKQNYSVWVTASNEEFTSSSSKVQIITFDEVTDVDELSNISMSKPNDTSVFLKWHKIREVDGYIVKVRLPSYYAARDDIKTSNDNITLIDLPTGVLMNIDVMAYKSNVIGRPFTLPYKTAGEPDEVLTLTASLSKDDGTTVTLSWNKPVAEKYKNRDVDYDVYYTNNMRGLGIGDMANATKITTKDTFYTITGLHSCESYVFTVGIRNGPLAKLKEIITRENIKSPVKNLQLEADVKQSKLNIKWQAACDALKDKVKYWIDISDLTHQKISRYNLIATKNTTLIHVIDQVPNGGRFNICVYTTEAAKTCGNISFAAPPPPAGLVAWLSPDGHVMVSWQPDNQVDHKYEVIISAKEIPEDLLHPTSDMTTVITDKSPLLTTTAAGVSPLYVSVRTLTKDGYYSDLSEVHTLHMEGLVAESSSLSGVWWAAGAAAAGAVLLAVVFHAVRSRRLPSSLFRFTAHTPRYDSRRGQATIGDHDEDDVPPIHGFSDDEPLVIA